MKQRQTWSSRLTYILTVAGATIGFGATWRFPYMVGEHGGGAYVLVFILAMILVGIPLILVENVIGRRAHCNSVDAFGGMANGKKIASIWKVIGYMGLIGAFGILAYYMVLGGWVISYVVNLILGFFHLSDLNLSQPVNKDLTLHFFQSHIENSPFEIGIFTFIFVVINWVILKKGIIEGIERSVKYLMPLLFLCLIAVVLRNLFLEGSGEGIKFYLMPDFSAITPELFLYVLGQVFFALSIGFGVMITLSSHLSKDENLIKTASITSVINTIIAILCGFMIFPALFSASLAPDSGPSLVFQTLPIAFSRMHFGTIFAIIFFLLLIIAALTTSITIYQVLISVLQEKFRFSKNTAINCVLGLTFILGNLPCILTYGPWSEVRFFGRNIFDSFDFISGNIFFIITAFLSCIFVGWVLKEEALIEFDRGFSKKPSFLSRIWLFYIRYVIVLIIAVIFLSGFFLHI